MHYQSNLTVLQCRLSLSKVDFMNFKLGDLLQIPHKVLLDAANDTFSQVQGYKFESTKYNSE